jgi:iron complex transport system ATP-binding protein
MRYGEAQVLRDVTLTFDRPGLTAIVGPNGAGKSTLLSIIAGLRRGYDGQCLLDGREVSEWRRRAMAKVVSFVPQSLRLEFPFTAEQVVMMGRTPYCDGLFESPEDIAEVVRAMELTDTLPFRDRDFRSLSGGERQRVVLASALAQEGRILLLDEPTTFLDLRHQVGIYALLRELAAAGRTVIAITHDLNLAAGHANRIILLNSGSVAADGTPAEVLNPLRLREVFQVDTQLMAGPGGRPWIVYGSEAGHP